MRKFLSMVFLFCLTSSIANAEAFQTNKPVICDSFGEVISFLTNEYKEKLTWMGKDLNSDTGYALLINEEKETWTFIQYNKETACVLGVGKTASEKGKKL
jgi:hypothetical protein